MLKKGKVQAALGELQQAAGRGGNDLLTLNRLGDLLARQGRKPDAVEHYHKVAGQFASGGFVPKAIAIYKKILRLDAQNLPAIIALGELYFQENLRGEAREYLLHAANQLLERREFDKAREILERLIEADPNDFRHRVRLAEARAASGDTATAGTELLALARSLVDSDQAPEAEKLYRRAAELVPDSQLPTLGLARCLTQQGQADVALGMLENAATEPTGSPAVLGELALCYDAAGRFGDALAVLSKAPVLQIPQSVWRTLLAGHVGRGAADDFWNQFDPRLDAESDSAAVSAVLAGLAETEVPGHGPALERLLALQRRSGDGPGAVRTATTLIEVYEVRSMADEAGAMRETLRSLSPQTDAPADPMPPAPVPVATEPTPAAVTRPAQAAAPPAAPPAGAPPVDLPADVEAPAVPLTRADEEFVAGRLTQAEVLEKYGLRPQALEQLDEVTSRYPGHVKAQESRVLMLRGAESPSADLHEALVRLAIAMRAEGDVAGAEKAAREALTGNLCPASRTILEQLGFVDGPRDVPSQVARDATPQPAPVAEDVDLVIDLDDGGLEIDEAPAVTEEARPGPAVVAGSNGETAAPDVTSNDGFSLGDDADLRAIAEALESELFDIGAEPARPEEDPEQALEDVFATFKERVAEQVGDKDYRTHYDLGIAYKEMGLVDDAILEFQLVTDSEELCRDACTMVAVCYRDLSRMEDAATWYRKALETPGADPESLHELRYDLAEALLESGNARGALAEFRDLKEIAASFRDVEGRVSELEAGLES